MTGEQEPVIRPIADMRPDEKTDARLADPEGYYSRAWAEEWPRAKAQVERELERRRQMRAAATEDQTMFTTQSEEAVRPLSSDMEIVNRVGRTGLKGVIGNMRVMLKHRGR